MNEPNESNDLSHTNQSNVPNQSQSSTSNQPQPLRNAGQMNFPDSMPHATGTDDILINEHGEPVPPPHQSGTAGPNDITWLAGKPIPTTEE